MAVAAWTMLLRLLVVVAASQLVGAAALVGETCSASSCGGGMRCTSCVAPPGTGPAACARTRPIDPAKTTTGLPFNRYSWLTTHNSFAVVGTKSPIGSAIISPPNQEDSVTAQLRNGVRGLMLDTYDFNNDVWLCHSFNGKCFAFTAYQPALSVLKEIQAFLEGNPSEVVTIFLEDYTAPGSLAKVLAAAGLTKYLFPVGKMQDGEWPLLRDMVAQNQRLVVFTSKQGKEASDGLAYEWNYVVETQYGSDGLAQAGQCRNRGESWPMDSKAQSLVLMNFFTTNPSQSWACGNNSSPLLITKLKACYQASANRWPNYIAVDFYMRSSGGGAPLATDVANGRQQCGRDSIAYCNSVPSPSPSPSPAPSAALAGGPGPATAPSVSWRRQAAEKEAAAATSTSSTSAAPGINHRRPWCFLFTGLLLLL